MKKTLNTVFALLLIILSAAGCITLYVFAVPKGEESVVYVISALLLFAGYLVGRFFHAFLHEIGHLLFGLCSGFRLYELAVGPFHFVKTGKHLRFYVKRNRYGGMVMMASKHADNLYRRYFTLTLGGVLFSLLTGAAWVAVAILLRNADYLLYSFLLPGAFASCYIIAMNVFAFENDGTYSDGAVLTGIRRRDSQIELNVSLMAIQGMLCAGKSPREIERRYFYEVPEAENCVNRVQLENYRYIYELDSGNTEEAIRLSDAIAQDFNVVPEIYRPGILTDVFYTELVLKKDVNRAKVLWYQIEKYIAHDLNVCNLRIRMAYELYAKEQPRLAIATGKTALSVKDEFIIPGVAKMEERIIETLMREAESRARDLDSKRMDDTLTEYRG